MKLKKKKKETLTTKKANGDLRPVTTVKSKKSQDYVIPKTGSSADPRLRQFIAGFAGQSKLDPIKTVEKVMGLQKQRGVRYLTAKQAKTVKSLTETSVTEVSSRGQLTDILMEVRSHQLALRGSIDLLVPYLIATYPQEFSQRARADRVEAIHQLWPTVSRYLTDLDRIQTLIELVIKDIDQAAYSLQRLTTLHSFGRSPVSHL